MGRLLKKATQLSDCFRHKDLLIKRSKKHLKAPFCIDGLKFGHKYASHMLEIRSHNGRWSKPIISPSHLLRVHPGSKVLNYAMTIFEGMKAYRGVDGKIRLFRPDKHMERFKLTAARMTLPDFNSEEMLKLICELVKLDKFWIPSTDKSALYIRPVFMGTESSLGVGLSNKALLYVVSAPVGPYYSTNFAPLSLLADPKYVRSFPGGVGEFKMGCNYAPTLYVQKMAFEMECQQALWLFGRDEKLTEVGVMNIFIYWINEKGEEELITPPLNNGLILPGVTRDTLLILANSWNEFKVTERDIRMEEIRRALKEKRLKQMFGTGTAAIVAPINRIRYMNPATNELQDLHIPTMKAERDVMKRFYDTILGIQYGRIEWPGWTRTVV